MASAVAAPPAAGNQSGPPTGGKADMYRDNKRKDDVRTSNIVAARAIADAVRTSLGPRGMDKMVCMPDGEVIITNDGATILQKMKVASPAAKFLVELSKSQDIVAGDGTTSVTVLAGSILAKCQSLLARGIHPTVISDGLQKAAEKSLEILEQMAQPVELENREALIQAAKTSLSSKVVSQYSSILAPIAVDSVLSIVDPERPHNLDLRDIKVVEKLGGTVDDSETIKGLVFNQKVSKSGGGPTSVKDAKIGLIQFQISPPKPDLENNVIISDYTQMDRVLREERAYILKIVKHIKSTGCNVLLIQKSILRDAVTDLSLHYLAKAKIMVIKDIERDEIEFISKTLGCLPISSLDHFRAEKLGQADIVYEEALGDARTVKVEGIKNSGKTACILVRGSNKLVLEEAGRSLHDALCVVRCLVHKRFLVAGGGAPEIELSRQLSTWAKTLVGMESHCVRAFAEALEVIPYTLAENAGLNPIKIVTELRARHAGGEKNAGIDAKRGVISNSLDENIVQPLLVTSSAIELATETVRMIMRIDDIVPTK